MSLDQGGEFVKPQTLTCDAFLGGKIHVLQPKAGFRAGMDSVLLGAAVGEGTKNLLDLGSGVGTAALCALARLPELTALLAEREPEMVELARRNIAENGFAPRANVAACDVTASGPERQKAGLVPDSFDSVIANPPFFGEASGTLAGEGTRARARAMPGGALDAWVRTAASAAAPGGEVIFIYRAEGLAALLDAFGRRFGGICVWPIAARPGEDAGRVLIRGIKGSRAPLTLKSPLVLHGHEGNSASKETDPIFRQGAPLLW